MSATKRPIEALEYALEFVKNAPIQRQQATILDEVNKHIWMSAPWRWSVGNVGSIALVNSQQDYTISAPNDMLFPLYAFIADTVSSPQYLTIEPKLPTDVIQSGQPERISYEGSNTWRLYPKPEYGTEVSRKTLVIQYKKQAPTITNQTSYTSGVLVMDDEWFWVYQLGVLWKAYLYADDSRAGSATINSEGKWQYSGMRAEFEAAIQHMKDCEKLPIFGYQTVPDPKVSK
jgi:hypothetical protein